MNAPVELATTTPLHGYAARQWRRRIGPGYSREVVLSILPADVVARVRGWEKAFHAKHAWLEVRHQPDGEVRVACYFATAKRAVP